MRKHTTSSRSRSYHCVRYVCLSYFPPLSMVHINLLHTGKRPRRTIYLTFVPDEEIGGVEGLGTWSSSVEFEREAREYLFSHFTYSEVSLVYPSHAMIPLERYEF